MNCVTCVFWSRNTDRKDKPHGGNCSCPAFVESGSTPLPKDGLIYWDYEGYSAGFRTGEDFGCVHWAAKP